MSTTHPAGDQAFDGLGSPSTNADILRYLTAIVESEQRKDATAEAVSGASNTTADMNNPDGLTKTQVRGLRHELMTYYNQPDQAGRLLRVLRRLKTRKISHDLLIDTGIWAAACLLVSSPDSDVKKSGEELMYQWMGLMLEKRYSIPADLRSKEVCQRMVRSLLDNPTRFMYSNSDPASQANKAREGSQSVAASELDKALTSNLSEHPTSVASNNLSNNNKWPGLTDKVSIVYGLGLSVEMALKCVAREKTPNRTDILSSASSRSRTLGLDVFGSIASLLRNTQLSSARALQVPRNESLVMSMKKEFLSEAKELLRVNNNSIEMLSEELLACQSSAKEAFHNMAMNHVVCVLGESYLTVLKDHVHVKEARIANVEEYAVEDSGELLEDLNAWKEIVSDIEEQLSVELGRQVDSLKWYCTRFLHPTKHVLDIVDPDSSASHSIDLASLTNSAATNAGLQTKNLALLAELSTSKKAEYNANEALHAASIEHKRLQELVDSERKGQAQIEANLQSERMRAADRASELRTKAKRVDDAEAAVIRTKETLEDANQTLKTVARERDRLASHNTDLEATCKELRADNATLQQGYDQMRQESEESHVRLVTLEAELSDVMEQLQDLHAQCQQAPPPPTVEHKRSQESTSNEISVLTHTDQLTPADRLDMIAQRWRKDLVSAKTEKQQWANRLQETEIQIADALRRLGELSPSPSKQHPKSRRGTDASHSQDGVATMTSQWPHTAKDLSPAQVPASHDATLEVTACGPLGHSDRQSQRVSSRPMGKASTLAGAEGTERNEFPPLPQQARPDRSARGGAWLNIRIKRS